MADCMMFPKDWHDFIKDYSFIDSEHVYTNGSELIQVLRVTQLIEHLLKEQETVEHAKEILCANGWEKMRFPEGTIGKWDDPEIVRCKDCWKREYDNCPFYDSFDYKPADDWFCADGEKERW